MYDKWKNFSIGVLATGAIALVVWVLVFLHPTFGDAGKVLRVRFTNVEKVGVGTRVTYAGRPVGEVIEMAMVPEARQDSSNSQEPIFIYELTLAIDSQVQLYSSDDIQVKTSGLMGEKTISITPKRSRDGTARLLGNDELIYATVGGSVEDTFQGLNNVTKKAEKTLDELIVLLDKNQANFQKTLQTLEGTSSEVQSLIKRANELDIAGNISVLIASAQRTFSQLEETGIKINNEKIIENVSVACNNLRQLSTAFDPKKVQDILTSVQGTSERIAALSQRAERSWNTVDEAMGSAAKTMRNIDSLLTQVAQGNGSIGKLLNNDDFYLRMQGILTKVDTTMSDVNHYGMLFHLDKSWQRERRKKILELGQLQTASEFKRYLNSELNRISNSISRVGIALDRAETSLSREDTTKNADGTRREFMRTYKELLGQLQALENTLKMYGGEHIAEGAEKPDSP